MSYRNMPVDLVLVRHGQSEGNLAQYFAKKGNLGAWTKEFRERHNSLLRLTDVGRMQASIGGRWIMANIGPFFDKYITSEYVRAMETASALQLPNARWTTEIYLRERDRGVLANKPPQEREQHHGDEMRRKEQDSFYWQPSGGESIANLCIRVDRVLESLSSTTSGLRVIIVCHGGVIKSFRALLERVRTCEYSPKEKILNCHIVWYSRRDPYTGIVSSRLSWVKTVCPWHSVLSRGTWRAIRTHSYTNDELMRSVALVHQLVNVSSASGIMSHGGHTPPKNTHTKNTPPATGRNPVPHETRRREGDEAAKSTDVSVDKTKAKSGGVGSAGGTVCLEASPSGTTTKTAARTLTTTTPGDNTTDERADSTTGNVTSAQEETGNDQLLLEYGIVVDESSDEDLEFGSLPPLRHSSDERSRRRSHRSMSRTIPNDDATPECVILTPDCPSELLQMGGEYSDADGHSDDSCWFPPSAYLLKSCRSRHSSTDRGNQKAGKGSRSEHRREAPRVAAQETIPITGLPVKAEKVKSVSASCYAMIRGVPVTPTAPKPPTPPANSPREIPAGEDGSKKRVELPSLPPSEAVLTKSIRAMEEQPPATPPPPLPGSLQDYRIDRRSCLEKSSTFGSELDSDYVNMGPPLPVSISKPRDIVCASHRQRDCATCRADEHAEMSACLFGPPPPTIRPPAGVVAGGDTIFVNRTHPLYSLLAMQLSIWGMQPTLDQNNPLLVTPGTPSPSSSPSSLPGRGLPLLVHETSRGETAGQPSVVPLADGHVPVSWSPEHAEGGMPALTATTQPGRSTVTPVACSVLQETPVRPPEGRYIYTPAGLQPAHSSSTAIATARPPSASHHLPTRVDIGVPPMDGYSQVTSDSSPSILAATPERIAAATTGAGTNVITRVPVAVPSRVTTEATKTTVTPARGIPDGVQHPHAVHSTPNSCFVSTSVSSAGHHTPPVVAAPLSADAAVVVFTEQEKLRKLSDLMGSTGSHTLPADPQRSPPQTEEECRPTIIAGGGTSLAVEPTPQTSHVRASVSCTVYHPKSDNPPPAGVTGNYRRQMFTEESSSSSGSIKGKSPTEVQKIHDPPPPAVKESPLELTDDRTKIHVHADPKWYAEGRRWASPAGIVTSHPPERLKEGKMPVSAGGGHQTDGGSGSRSSPTGGSTTPSPIVTGRAAAQPPATLSLRVGPKGAALQWEAHLPVASGGKDHHDTSSPPSDDPHTPVLPVPPAHPVETAPTTPVTASVQDPSPAPTGSTSSPVTGIPTGGSQVSDRSDDYCPAIRPSDAPGERMPTIQENAGVRSYVHHSGSRVDIELSLSTTPTHSVGQESPRPLPVEDPPTYVDACNDPPVSGPVTPAMRDWGKFEAVFVKAKEAGNFTDLDFDSDEEDNADGQENDENSDVCDRSRTRQNRRKLIPLLTEAKGDSSERYSERSFDLCQSTGKGFEQAPPPSKSAKKKTDGTVAGPAQTTEAMGDMIHRRRKEKKENKKKDKAKE